MADIKYTDLSGLEHFSDTIKSILDSKANTSSLGSYYTKAQVNNLLSGKSDTHNHNYLPLGGGTLTGDLNFQYAYNITWADGSWWQRINITDDSNADTSVFKFQQSSDTGSTWTDLLTIRDNGKVIANTFIGNLSGKADTAGHADSAYSVSSYSTASSSSDKRKLWFDWSGYNGYLAVSDNLTFQTSTNTLFSPYFSGYLNGSCSGSAGSVAWSNVSGKPSTFTPSTHSHDYLPLAGGTISNADFSPLTIERTSTENAAIGFKNNEGMLGHIAIMDKDGSFRHYNGDATAFSYFLDTDNYKTYCAESGHNHNTSYYTKTEVNNLLANKSNTHTHPYLSTSGGVLGGDLNFNGTYSIKWNDGTYHQRIAITDDATADTNVFSFQQSTNSGSTWNELFTIKDNGKVIASGFYKTDGSQLISNITKKMVTDALGYTPPTSDTNDKVKQSPTSSSNTSPRPLLIGAAYGSSAIFSPTEVTDTVLATHKVSIYPNTGLIVSEGGFQGPLTGNVTGNCTGSSGSCTGNAATATAVSSWAPASSVATKRRIWISHSDNSNNVAYSDDLTFQTSTNTLFSPNFSGYLNGSCSGSSESTYVLNPIELSVESLNDLYTPGRMYFAGGSNSVTNKPTGVDAFGLLNIRAASGWYGQLLLSSNTSTGLYYRADASSADRVWKKLLDSSNYTAYCTPANIGAAAASHGNHVPAVQTANNAKFLRNDNTWATVTPANIGAAASSHTHATLSSWAQASGGSYRYVWVSWSDNTGNVAYTDTLMMDVSTANLKTALGNDYSIIGPGYIKLRNDAALNPTANKCSIEFSYNGGQEVYLAYTPNDSYRASKGLKVFGSSNDNANCWFEVEGNCYAKAFFQTSDENLKDFKDDIQVDLDKIKSLPKKYFTWKDDESKENQIGTSAQAVQEIYPELVSTNSDGTLSVAYDKLSVIALKAVDELHTKNQELEERLKRIEKMLNI